MLCDFLFDADGDKLRATCARCGRVVRTKSRRVFAACRAAETPLTNEEVAAAAASGADPDGWRPVPVGDLVARGLQAVGVTEERVRRLTRSRDCGCSRRRSALNVHGERLQRRIRRAVLAVKEFALGQ